jgi:tetratricopeptide (TPR) repeat protein
MGSMTIGAFVLLASLAGQVPAAPPVSAPVPTDVLSKAYLLFLQGRSLEGRGDAKGAIAAYRQAADALPQSAEIRAELASLFAREGQTDEAIKEARAALGLDPQNPEAHRTLGFVQSELAETTADATRAAAMVTEAIGHLAAATNGRGVDPGAQLALGRLYVRAGQYAKGIETLRAFLLDEPVYAEAMLLLAQAYDSTHQTALAISALEELVADQPDQLRAWAWLAELDEQNRQWKAAAAAWGELATRSPRNLTYRTRRATALVNGGDLPAGRQALVDITQAAPREVSAWYLLSQVDRRAGNAAAAEEAARHIAEIDPTDPRGPLALAEAKASRGDYRAVVEALEPLVAAARPEDVASGSYARMAGELSAALQKTGDRARAVKVLEDARRRDAKDLDLLFDLAAAYERDDRFDQAEQTFRDVLANEPTNAEALNYLGYMLADRGTKLDEAVDLIQRALVIDANNPSFLDSLGWAYVKQAKLDQARAPLQRAAAALPKTSVIQDHLAELYFQLKLYREAAAAWDKALAGDQAGIDAAAVTKKRDRARQLAGK